MAKLTPIYEQVLKELKLRRVKLGLLQPQIDTKINKSKGNYSKIERGLVGIELNKLSDIAKSMGLHVKISFYEMDGKI